MDKQINAHSRNGMAQMGMAQRWKSKSQNSFAMGKQRIDLISEGNERNRLGLRWKSLVLPRNASEKRCDDPKGKVMNEFKMRRQLQHARDELTFWKRLSACLFAAAIIAATAALTLALKANAETQDASVEAEAPAVQAEETAVEPVIAVLEAEPEILEEDENSLIEAALLEQATRIDNVTITHYCTCKRCCGKSDGITASGVTATPNVTVAVDPKVIPLGSTVLIDWGDGELQYCRADDTGSAIKGNKIDLCVEDHQTALELGVRKATVYWVEE